MKFVIVFVALFAVAFARPNADSDAQIIKQFAEVLPDGFKYEYETSNGIKEDAEGKLKDVGAEQEAIVVRGSFSWVDEEGKTHSFTYVADDNGYQPLGDDIPKVEEQ